MPELTWSSESDWDSAQSRANVVTSAVGPRDPDVLSLGYDPNDDLVSQALAYWSLDDTDGSATDHVGSYTGSYEGPTLAETSWLGTPVAYFDGSDSVEISNAGGLGGTDELTLSLWVNWESLNSYNDLIGYGYESYLLTCEDGTDLVFYLNGDYDGTVISSIDTGEWIHIAATWEGGAGTTFYVNGEDVGSDDGTASYSEVPDDSGTFGIGTDLDYGSYSDASLGHAMVFDMALPASEIDTLATVMERGTLTTGERSHDGEATDLSTTATLPNDTDLSITVHQDTSGDGTADNSQTISVGDGSQTESLSSFSEAAGSVYWGVIELETDDENATPTLERAAIRVVDGDSTGPAAIGSVPVAAAGAVYEVPIYDPGDLESAGYPVGPHACDANGTVGAFRLVDQSDSTFRCATGGSIYGLSLNE